MGKRRVDYFDIAKGMGIILVVMGHLEYISTPLRYFIVSFHMPLFFVISGMLMRLTKEEEKALPTYVKGKIKRIAIPYLIYSLLFLVLEIGYMYLTNTVNWMAIIQNAYLSVCLYGNSVLWFLPAMFFGGLAFYALRAKLSHKGTTIMVLVITALMYGINMLNGLLNALYSSNLLIAELYFFFAMIIRSGFALFYLAVGYYLYMLLEERFAVLCPVESSKSLPIIVGKIICSTIILAVIAWSSQVNGAVDIHFLIFGNPAIYLFNSVMGSLSVILIASALEGVSQTPPMRLLRLYGQNSLTIMATHMDCYIMYVSILAAMFFSKFITRARSYIFCGMILVFVFIAETVIITIKNKLHLEKFL